MNEQLLTTSEAAALLGISERTLRKISSRPGGPHPIRIGRAVRYSQADLAAYLAPDDGDLTMPFPKSQYPKVKNLREHLPEPDASAVGKSKQKYSKTEHGQIELRGHGPDCLHLYFRGDNGLQVTATIHELAVSPGGVLCGGSSGLSVTDGENK